MARPPRIPDSRPPHPFGRLAFPIGIGILVTALVMGALMLRSDDADTRNNGVALLTVVGVCLFTIGLLTLLERVIARRGNR